MKRQLSLQVFLLNDFISIPNFVYIIIISHAFSVQWAYNILEHKAESDRIIYEDNHPENGFILAPDLKWDGKTAETLYLLAICHKRNIKSIRDLNSEHLPLLKNILNEGSVRIQAFVFYKIEARDVYSSVILESY